MGIASRLKQKRIVNRKNEDELIEEERKEYPNLWCKTYTVTIKRPLSEVFKRSGCPFLVIDTCGTLDTVCNSADIWAKGLSEKIREKFKD